MNFIFLNIPVRICPSFWITLLFFTGILENPGPKSVIIGIVFIMSLLVHEYGHALTALYFGARPEVTLEAFGGKATYKNFGITPKQEFLITLNGPLFESSLILFSWLLLKSGVFADHYYMQYFLYVTMRVNTIWVLLNLIPVLPLDGGHLVRNLLENKFGQKGYATALILSLASVAFVAPYLYFQNFFFFGSLLIVYAFKNCAELRQILTFSTKNPFAAYLNAVELMRKDDIDGAERILKKNIKTKDPKIKHWSLESLAKVYFLKNEAQAAYKMLVKADPEFLKEGKVLLCKLAFDQKNYALVGKYSRDIYEIDPAFEIAVLNSKAFARLNEPALAGAWFETASQFGTECRARMKDVLTDEAYDSVREQVVFKQYQDYNGPRNSDQQLS